MKKKLMFLILSTLIAASAGAADVSIKVPDTEEIFACNAGREFSSADDNNPGSVIVTASGAGLGSSGRELTRNSSMLAPLSSSWNIKISQLSFGLSTEKYGASYSIYFCYRGPAPTKAIDPATGKADPKSKDSTAGIYKATAAISASLKEYANKAKLTYSVGLSCQFRNANSNSPVPIDLSQPESGSVNPQFFGSWGPYYFSSNRQISAQLNSNKNFVPTFCMFKVTLTERETTERQNTLPAADFSVGLDVFKISGDDSLEEAAH